jgi:hypothetical protein
MDIVFEQTGKITEDMAEVKDTVRRHEERVRAL